MTQTINVGTSADEADAPKGMVAHWFYKTFGCSTKVAEYLSSLVIIVVSGTLVFIATSLGITVPGVTP